MIVKEYLLQNWALILILLAFIISIITSVFLDKKTTIRMYILVAAVFLLSIVVFAEFYFADIGEHRWTRIVFMAIRYSATPFILAQVMFTLTKKLRWFIFIPAIVLAVLNIVSIFTGIVFTVNEENTFIRGPLGFIPFIIAGLYCVALLYILVRRSNKRLMEIIPIIFLAITFASGLILPFVFGSDYANLFSLTIAIALFSYYEFSALQLTKKDSLTGLLNRQAYFSDTRLHKETINAIILIDMNGLKHINDNYGHSAGDEALVSLSLCIIKSLKRRQSGYRIGGDEFIIVSRKSTEEEVVQLIDRIKKYVSETQYSCSIGYGYSNDGSKDIEDMLKDADSMMYIEKEQYYKDTKKDRRQR